MFSVTLTQTNTMSRPEVELFSHCSSPPFVCPSAIFPSVMSPTSCSPTISSGAPSPFKAERLAKSPGNISKPSGGSIYLVRRRVKYWDEGQDHMEGDIGQTYDSVTYMYAYRCIGRRYSRSIKLTVALQFPTMFVQFALSRIAYDMSEFQYFSGATKQNTRFLSPFRLI